MVGSSTGTASARHVERVGDVGDPAEVVVQRVGLVDAHAAVQVVAGAQRRRPLGAGPVRRDREVVAHVEPLVEPPGGVLGGEVEGARGDVDVGDLHRDRLELGQRPAELGAALDVGRGEVAGAGDDTGRGQAETGDVALGQQPARHRRRGSSAGAPSRTTVCVVIRALEPDSSRVTPGSLTSTRATTGWSPCIAVTRSRGRSVRVGDADLAAGDRAVGVRRRGGGGDRATGLAQRGRQEERRRSATPGSRAAAARRCRPRRASARRSRASPRPAGASPGRRSRGAARRPRAARDPRRRRPRARRAPAARPRRARPSRRRGRARRQHRARRPPATRRRSGSHLRRQAVSRARAKL